MLDPFATPARSVEAVVAELPRPTRERWQPLRIGLVELFHYDVEEFWFRDGHLLLRGNNGTGKSKVLSLTLPFLLDASLSPARVEPDGDRGKRMEWNLLLGRHERRTGYSWVEFGRRGEDGREHFLTLGCGLQAVLGRSRVDPPWYFMTELRVGAGLHLISAERTVLSRDRLNQALEARGRVFENAREYRREVDLRLFRLGDRYAGLIDTLIQLRQPQLSKKPDEQNLSQALSNALPELPQAVLEDVADAMNQLDEYRDELARIEQVRDAVEAFGRRYRVYAQIQARRQARLLRQAQTEFDNRSRELNEALEALDAATGEVNERTGRVEQTDLRLLRERAAWDELKSDPAMTDARRLEDLERATERALRERDEAYARGHTDRDRLALEQAELARRDRECQSARQRCEAHAAELAEHAEAAGIAAEHRPAMAQLLAGVAGPPQEVAQPPQHGEAWRELADTTPSPDQAARSMLEDALARRERQIDRVRALIGRRDAAERTRDAAEARAADRRQQLAAAEERARAADQALLKLSAALIDSWRGYAAQLQWLSISDVEQKLAELEEWVRTLSFEQPFLEALDAAYQRAQLRLATRTSELELERRRLEHDAAELRAEQERLRAGGQLIPTPLPTRELAARATRPGAPFWQLLEFRDHVTPQQRAALEAALEGAGLLDAWVSPAAHVLNPDTDDAWLMPGARRASSLLDWLVPGESAAVEPARVAALLASIAAGDCDDTTADSWIGSRGEFRIGRLSGAHHKPQALYLGHAARETARQQRLSEIARQLDALALQLTAADEAARAIADERRALADELARAPKHDAVRGAHADFAAAERVRREAQDRLAEAEGAHEAARSVWAEAQRELEEDARDLALPSATDALSSVARSVAAYRSALSVLWHALEARGLALREQSRQRERAERAAAQLSISERAADERAREYEDIAARRDLLLESAGAAIAELRRRLHEAQNRVHAYESALERARRELSEAQGKRVSYQERVRADRERLEDAAARRQDSVGRLRGFANTGLLGVATPELTPPDRDHWTIDPALQLARRVEERLVRVADDDRDWTRIQGEISSDYTALGQALSALGQRAAMETTDYGMVVQVIYGNRSERPDLLAQQLGEEARQRREILSAREREVLENHLQSEVAANLQRLLHEAEQRVQRINEELKRRPTTTGVYFRLEWEPLPEGDGGAPVGLGAARTRLLRRVPEAWSAEDRRVLGDFLRARIDQERALDDSSPLIEHLSRALDYRRWHRFRVKRWHDGAFRPLSGPASSGERALGLTVPLFAAASSYYESSESGHVPRLVLLDEAFAGIDDEARSHCMALIREFDLDFVMTSEREWGCYATLPGVSICQIIRREGIDGVYVSRWSWDGKQRREEPDIVRSHSRKLEA